MPASCSGRIHVARTAALYAQIPLIYGVKTANRWSENRESRAALQLKRILHALDITALLQLSRAFISVNNRRWGRTAESGDYALDVFHCIRTLYVFILQRTSSPFLSFLLFTIYLTFKSVSWKEAFHRFFGHKFSKLSHFFLSC
jgi:hypothetical protein